MNIIRNVSGSGLSKRSKKFSPNFIVDGKLKMCQECHRKRVKITKKVAWNLNIPFRFQASENALENM